LNKFFIQKTGVFLITFSLSAFAKAQMITGVWKGKINKQNAEIKIIQSGDSLLGSSYYYKSADNYRRYTIKGYFDAITNEAIWWDDQLIEERSGRPGSSIPGRIPLLSRADFNCPGGSKMMLDGKSVEKENEIELKGDVHLDKSNNHLFEDEWDFVIDNYTAGANDPYIIDSVSKFAEQWPLNKEDRSLQDNPKSLTTDEKNYTPAIEKQIETATTKTELPKEPQPVAKTVEPVKTSTPTIEQKFAIRKKVLTTEIPLAGDSIELRFYDNAIVDGDSISLFLNDKLVFEHIRLLRKAYIIKLSVSDLKEGNELIMVAENLGSIPPNTAYMVAIVDDKRYEARLESSEGSSAMIRFVKKSSEDANLKLNSQ